MKATLTVNIEEIGKEIVVEVDSYPTELPYGPLRAAANMIASKVGNCITEFYDDVKALNANKPPTDKGWKVTDLEMAAIVIRLIRSGNKFKAQLKAPDLMKIENTEFKDFATNIIAALETSVDQVHAKEDAIFKSKRVTDQVLREFAWAQRN